jgi:Protein of unknown function (DUF2946)
VGVLPMTLALRHAVKFFPSCRGSIVRAKFRLMGIGMKRFFVSAAICQIALQTILLGLAPLASLSSGAVDPFLIICRSEGQPHASDSSNGGSGSHRSGEDCLHCVLCTTSTPPLVPSASIGVVALASFVLFLRPSLAAPYVGRVSGRTFARGPPQFAMTN